MTIGQEARRILETHAWSNRELWVEARRSVEIIEGFAVDENYLAETWISVVNEFVHQDDMQRAKTPGDEALSPR